MCYLMSPQSPGTTLGESPDGHAHDTGQNSSVGSSASELGKVPLSLWLHTIQILSWSYTFPGPYPTSEQVYEDEASEKR